MTRQRRAGYVVSFTTMGVETRSEYAPTPEEARDVALIIVKTGAAALAAVLLLTACASVRHEDLQSWVGVPVSQLDRRPVFLTMQSVRTQTADGVEIRNYVNGQSIGSCSGSGTVYAGYVSM